MTLVLKTVLHKIISTYPTNKGTFDCEENEAIAKLLPIKL